MDDAPSENKAPRAGRFLLESRDYSGKHSKEHSLPKSFKYYLEMRVSVALICNRYRNLVVLFSSFNDTKIVKIKIHKTFAPGSEIIESKWAIGTCVIIVFDTQRQYGRIITDLLKPLKNYLHIFLKIGKSPFISNFVCIT